MEKAIILSEVEQRLEEARRQYHYQQRQLLWVSAIRRSALEEDQRRKRVAEVEESQLKDAIQASYESEQLERQMAAVRLWQGGLAKGEQQRTKGRLQRPPLNHRKQASASSQRAAEAAVVRQSAAVEEERRLRVATKEDAELARAIQASHDSEQRERERETIRRRADSRPDQWEQQHAEAQRLSSSSSQPGSSESHLQRSAYVAAAAAGSRRDDLRAFTRKRGGGPPGGEDAERAGFTPLVSEDDELPPPLEEEQWDGDSWGPPTTRDEQSGAEVAAPKPPQLPRYGPVVMGLGPPQLTLPPTFFENEQVKKKKALLLLTEVAAGLLKADHLVQTGPGLSGGAAVTLATINAGTSTGKGDLMRLLPSAPVLTGFPNKRRQQALIRVACLLLYTEERMQLTPATNATEIAELKRKINRSMEGEEPSTISRLLPSSPLLAGPWFLARQRFSTPPRPAAPHPPPRFGQRFSHPSVLPPRPHQPPTIVASGASLPPTPAPTTRPAGARAWSEERRCPQGKAPQVPELPRRPPITGTADAEAAERGGVHQAAATSTAGGKEEASGSADSTPLVLSHLARDLPPDTPDVAPRLAQARIGRTRTGDDTPW